MFLYIFSSLILTLSFILTLINWKILKISNEVLEETIKVRKSLEITDEKQMGTQGSETKE